MFDSSKPEAPNRNCRSTTVARFTFALLVTWLPLSSPVWGQGNADPFVELNLAGTVSLPRLVEAVSKQLDIRFLYSADLANRQVTVYTPARLPKSALPALLGSLLKGENLAVVDSDVPGWKRIVDFADMVPYAQPGEATEVLAKDGPAAAVTQVIPIKNADITSLSQTLRPFLSKAANFLALPENHLIIVTDYAKNVKRVTELLRLIDQPVGQAIVEFYDTKNRDPASLIQQVETLITQADGAPGEEAVKLFNDTSDRRVVVAGEKNEVTRVLQLLAQLDTGMGFQTRVYRLQNVSAQRINKLVIGLVSSKEAETSIETTIDPDGNLLIVRAPAEIHRQIETLIEELDRPVDSSESPIQFYKLKNANAVEVLYSLLALQQAAGSGSVAQVGGFGAVGAVEGFGFTGLAPAFGVGDSLTPAGITPSAFSGALPVYRGQTGGRDVRMPFNDGNANDVTDSTLQNENEALGPLIGGGGIGGVGGIGAVEGFGIGASQVATLPGGARVSADVATNSLIVYAPANVQPLYAKLIRSLDQRRPQVMIEAEIVAVNTSDDFRLGVEVSIGDRTGAMKLFKFTSFGLSEVDPTNGMLTPKGGTGFNGVLLDPDVADVIIQALSTHSRSRVLASPKILVNDNQTGTLESVESVPFSSINSINTISSNSLGGSQQAGTIITVTPHINEDDHLQLEFDIEFSTFEGELIPTGGENGGFLPPQRKIDRIGSVVTIPDGQTVVVGGLKRGTETDSFSGVPWTEKIPVLRELTSLTVAENKCTSFFLFIRPRILRDSQFRDLRYLSDIDVQTSEVPGDVPQSRPMLIPCVTPPTQTRIPPNPGRHQRPYVGPRELMTEPSVLQD
ncbi:MAG: secretin N-terminal domain-containing protein [Rubripirellula sp.]